MNRPFLALLALVASAFLAACAATPAEPVSVDQRLADKGFRVDERVDRIANFRLNGWSYVDLRHVILNSGVRDRYLSMLDELARRFVGHDGVIGYDLLNEPWGWEASELLPLYEDATDTIRAADPEAIMFIEPHASTNADLTRILFGSNWGRSGSGEVELFMIGLPPGWERRLP